MMQTLVNDMEARAITKDDPITIELLGYVFQTICGTSEANGYCKGRRCDDCAYSKRYDFDGDDVKLFLELLERGVVE